MNNIFTRIAGRIAFWAGQPTAFIMAVLLIIVWAVTGPMFAFSETWQLVVNTGTTIVTFLMVFLVQNSQNRDAAAMQAKLDELIRALESAQNDYIGIEHLNAEEIEEIRLRLERGDCPEPGWARNLTTIQRLQHRQHGAWHDEFLRSKNSGH